MGITLAPDFFPMQGGYITPAFSGVSSAQHAGKIRNGLNQSKMAT